MSIETPACPTCHGARVVWRFHPTIISTPCPACAPERAATAPSRVSGRGDTAEGRTGPKEAKNGV